MCCLVACLGGGETFESSGCGGGRLESWFRRGEKRGLSIIVMRGRPSFPGSGRVSTDRLRESLGEIRAGSGLTPPLVAAHPYMQQADTHTQQRQITAKKKRRKNSLLEKGDSNAAKRNMLRSRLHFWSMPKTTLFDCDRFDFKPPRKLAMEAKQVASPFIQATFLSVKGDIRFLCGGI